MRSQSCPIFQRTKKLKEGGIETAGIIFIAKNTHVITNSHMEEDKKDNAIGTTKRGNGPAYRDKYARSGLRAEHIPELQEYMIDMYKELHTYKNPNILFEGAQGFGLDIDWGDYPYVTSSHCTTAAALLNGIPPQAVQKVWGVAKAYETYVGAKQFQPEGDIYNMLREIGAEYGTTTGRPRQCNWMNWDLVEKAININGVTDLVFNKMDVLRKLGHWTIRKNGQAFNFSNEDTMKDWILASLKERNINVHFSGDKEKI